MLPASSNKPSFAWMKASGWPSRDEQEALGGPDLALQPLDGLRLVGVVILVVERQVADLHLPERELRWCQSRDGVRELAVERVAAKAADHDGNLVLAHVDLLHRGAGGGVEVPAGETAGAPREPAGAGRRARHGGRRAGPVDHSAVDRGAGPADRLEIQVVSGDLHHHEVVVGVERLGGDVRGAEVPLAQPATGSGHPVHDAALLGLDALVDVVVPGERGGHAVLDEEGLQDRPRLQRGPVGPARRVQGVVEERDLPVRARGRELLLQPVELGFVQVGGVEGEEAHAAFGQLRDPAFGRPEGVVTLASHVEELVETLVRVVVVAEGGTEHDSGVEERLVGRLELVRHFRWRVGTDDVVSHHDHESERKLGVERDHLRRHLVLRSRARPRIPHHRESDGAVLPREGERAGDGGLGRGRGAEGGGWGWPESQPEGDEETADRCVLHGIHLTARSGAAAGRMSAMSWATESTRMRSRRTNR